MLTGVSDLTVKQLKAIKNDAVLIRGYLVTRRHLSGGAHSPLHPKGHSEINKLVVGVGVFKALIMMTLMLLWVFLWASLPPIRLRCRQAPTSTNP